VEKGLWGVRANRKGCRQTIRLHSGKKIREEALAGGLPVFKGHKGEGRSFGRGDIKNCSACFVR